MAKKFEKVFAMLLVLCMLVGMIPVGALAEEAENTDVSAVNASVEVGEDNVVVVTFEPVNNDSADQETDTEKVEIEWETELHVGEGITETVTDAQLTEANDEEGNTVVTESATIATEGMLDENTTVEGEETYTQTTVTSSEGMEQQIVEQSGTETTESEVDDDTSDVHLNVDVEVEMIPGQTTSNTETVEDSRIDGDVPADENQKNFDYTITETVTERVVEVTTSEITITETAGDVEMTPVNPEDYEGKVNAGDQYGYGTTKGWGPDRTGVAYIEVPARDENGELITNEDGSSVMVKIPDPEQWNENWDYQYFESGERSISGSVYTTVVTFVRDKDKNIVYDENGYPKYTMGGFPNPHPNTAEGRVVGTKLNILWDKEGNLVYAYCLDKETGTDWGQGFVLENLDDCEYFPTEAAKEEIRSVMLNGYVGVKEGNGSLNSIKDSAREWIEGEEEITFTVGKVTYTNTTEEGKAQLLAMLEALNEGDALNSTQAAIWSYSNGTVAYKDYLAEGTSFYGFNIKSGWGDDFTKNDPNPENGGAVARMWLAYHYLMNLEPEKTTETTVINRESFLAEDGLKLTVGDKVEDHANNRDKDADNDVYNVDLSFTMLVEPSTENGDDLVVSLYNAEGELVSKARLAGDDSNDDSSFTQLVKQDSTYTFKDLQLSENSDITFDLRLEGVQNLKEGVYVYKAVDTNGVSGYDKGQTMIGISKGKQDVHIKTKFTLNFNVDEKSNVKTTRVWKKSSDPVEDEQPPVRYRVPNKTITEEDIPLADVPQTGDMSVVWFAMIMLSACGLCVLRLMEKNTRKSF